MLAIGSLSGRVDDVIIGEVVTGAELAVFRGPRRAPAPTRTTIHATATSVWIDPGSAGKVEPLASDE